METFWMFKVSSVSSNAVLSYRLRLFKEILRIFRRSDLLNRLKREFSRRELFVQNGTTFHSAGV